MQQTQRSIPWRRNALLFILSQAITLLGSSIVQMAIIWQVALETSSGLWVTLLTLSAMLPQTVMSLFAGVWADRYPHKRLIIIADAGIAVVTLVLAAVLASGTAAGMLPMLIAVSALRSVGAGLQTPAVSAAIPHIVPGAHLMRYNGINGSVMAIVQFAAPAAAGAILALGTFTQVLLLDVGTAAVGIGLLLLVRMQRRAAPQAAGEGGSFFFEMRAGIAYAAHDRLVGRLLLCYGAYILLCVPSGFLAVLMIQRTFGDSYLYLTISEMAGFAGMVLGGLALGVWGGFADQRKTLFLALVAYGGFSLAIGFASAFWLFAALMFFTSLFIPVVQSAVTTMLQAHVDEARQGRVFGLLGAMYSGFMPLGMAIFGPLADVVRIQSMVIVCGGVIVAMGLWGWVHKRALPAKETA